MRHLRRCVILLLLCLGIAPLVALAQDCPAIVKAALTAADSSCSTTGRDQACYGNIQLQAVPQPNTANFVFAQPGDKVDVSGIQSLSLSSMDQAQKQWGVAVMRLQANLPDTLPGQNVTMVLFGNVQLDSAVTAPVTIELTAKNKANVRATPSTSGSVVGSLAGGQTITADGRNADSTWFRIQLEDGTSGWVFANLVTISGDATTLAEVDASAPAAAATSAAGPQAFYFKSGTGDLPCAEAPNGLLIQSPAGAERVQLTVNDVNLSLGSTVFLQTPSDSGGQMVVSTLSGLAQVEAGGVTQNVIEGAQTSVPLGADGKASGTPTDPQPYDSTLLTPVVANMIEGRQLFVPLENDSSDLLKSLIGECKLTPLTADQTVLSLSDADLQTASKCISDYLASQVTLPTAGQWTQPTYRMTTTGKCLEAAVADGGAGGGGGNLPTIPVYGIKLNGKSPYLIVGDNQAYPHVEGTTDTFGADRAPYYDALRDKSFQTIGTIKITYTDQYKVIAPDQIQVTISSVEDGGCTTSGTYVLTLAQADDSVIDQSNAEQIISAKEQAAAEVDPELVPGNYNVSYDPLPADCTGDIAPPDVTSMSLAKSGDYGISITAGSDTYTVYKGGAGYYQYSTGFGAKRKDITLSFSSDSYLLLWSASDGSNPPCSASATLKLSS